MTVREAERAHQDVLCGWETLPPSPISKPNMTNTMTDITTISEPLQIDLFGPNGYAQFSETGLEIKGADKDIWLKIADATTIFETRVNGAEKREIPWITGDLMAYGEDNFGEEAFQAIDPVAYDPKTLANRMAVCRAIPFKDRRKQLTFSHHAEVYKLEFNQREEVLELAISDRLSVSDVRKLVKDRYPSEKSLKAKEKRELKKLTEQTDVVNIDSEAALDEPTAVYYARKFTEYLELQQEEFKDYSTDRIEQYEALFAAINRMARKMKNAKKDVEPTF